MMGRALLPMILFACLLLTATNVSAENFANESDAGWQDANTDASASGPPLAADATGEVASTVMTAENRENYTLIATLAEHSLAFSPDSVSSCSKKSSAIGTASACCESFLVICEAFCEGCQSMAFVCNDVTCKRSCSCSGCVY